MILDVACESSSDLSSLRRLEAIPESPISFPEPCTPVELGSVYM